jgi:hypothetical protein
MPEAAVERTVHYKGSLLCSPLSSRDVRYALV